jgi:hypothetical protein
MLCHVLRRGIVAAKCGAACLTGAQVQPGTIMFYTFFANLPGAYPDIGDSFQM